MEGENSETLGETLFENVSETGERAFLAAYRGRAGTLSCLGVTGTFSLDWMMMGIFWGAGLFRPGGGALTSLFGAHFAALYGGLGGVCGGALAADGATLDAGGVTLSTGEVGLSANGGAMGSETVDLWTAGRHGGGATGSEAGAAAGGVAEVPGEEGMELISSSESSSPSRRNSLLAASGGGTKQLLSTILLFLFFSNRPVTGNANDDNQSYGYLNLPSA